MTRTRIIGILASAVIAMSIVILVTMKANADDETESFKCRETWSQPMRQVCESKTMVCVQEFGSDEMECTLKPVKE